MKKTIKWYVFEHSDWEKSNGFKVDESRCRHSVHDREIWRSFQCSRKPTTTIQGYGFCTQHAKMVKAELVLLDE